MYNLIFSDKLGQRIKRHVIFWIVFYVYQVVRMSFLIPDEKLAASLGNLLINSARWGVFFNVLFTYSITYYLIPIFFEKKRYFLFGLAIACLFMVIFGLSFFSSMVSKMTQFVGTTKEQPYIHLRGTIVRLFGNPPLVCALFLSLKTLKKWHLKQLENEQLSRERANAELQLLTAQIHPHFLFNTLNNIYSFTLTKSPLASELVQKLSDMLNYMTTDCEGVLVPVEKEIQLLKDYIGLEKVRYGDRLDIQMHINGDSKNCMIVPLLMIPFVENSFKHGASIMRGKQWMHLIININEKDLEFHISNSKPALRILNKNKNGIGLLNVQKRLSLLYPNKHQLQINSTDNTFSVYMKIELVTNPLPIKTERISNIPAETFPEPTIHN